MFFPTFRRDASGSVSSNGALATRRPRLYVVAAAALAVLMLIPAVPASSQTRRPFGVEGVTPITEVLSYGQKVTAVAVQYGHEVSWRNLDLESFTVSDSTYNFRFNPIGDLTNPEKRENRTITAVYTNSSAALRDDQQSVPGNWVIIELEPRDIGGPAVMAWAGGVRVIDDLQTRVVQNDDIFKLVNSGRNTGSLLSSGGPQVYAPTAPAVNLVADDFTYERWTTPGGTMVPYAYQLPENYDPAGSYPMVVILPGQGQGYRESGGLNNEGVHVASDIPAAAWNQPEWTGTDEGVIVLAVQNQRVGSATVQANVMVELVKKFAGEYAVDQDRIYGSTVSYGSTLAWSALTTDPGLFDAMLITGGFGASVAQANAIAASGTPVFITHGINDHLLNVVTTGQASYNRIWAAYQTQGKTPAQINNLLRYEEYPLSAFYEPDAHLAAAPTYENYSILQWLLAQ